MAEIALRDELSTLHTQALERIAGLERDLREQQAEHARLMEQMRTLQEQLADSNEYRKLIEDDLERTKAVWERGIFEKAQEALGRSRATLMRAAPQLHRREQLRQQCRALLDRDPALQEDVRQYRDFEAMAAPALQMLPDLHRQAVLSEQERLRQRLSEYFVLEEQEAGAAYRDVAQLSVILMQNPDRPQIALITPFAVPAPDDGDPTGWHEISETIIEMLRRASLEPEWRFSDLEEVGWAGYRSLVATGEFIGREDPVTILGAYIQRQSERIPLLAGIALSVEVAEITYGAWSLGCQIVQTVENLTVVEVAEEKNTGLGPFPIASISLQGGWYTTADLASWERPLKVVAGSQWNMNARRLRTVLMRMVGYGVIGGNGVQRSALWQGLPEPHREAMEESVSKLIASGLVTSAPTDDGTEERVSINQDMLGQLEVLINRDISEFWANIVG